MASASNAQLGTGSIRQNFAKKYRNTSAFTISLTKIIENKDNNANCRRKVGEKLGITPEDAEKKLKNMRIRNMLAIAAIIRESKRLLHCKV